ncbi:EAL domain-containing protein [Candidatus Gracilibacteria bacterium]|nr:EAL domain-containing protein [Candidatus Gracilibacteria bacterium]
MDENKGIDSCPTNKVHLNSVSDNADQDSLTGKKPDTITQKVIGFFQAKVENLISFTDLGMISRIGKKIPIGLSIVSILTTINVWYMERGSIIQNLSNQIDKQLSEVTFPIQGRILAYEQILLGTRGLFDSSNSITRDEYNSYISSLNLKKNFPEIQGISVSFSLTEANISQHIEAVQKEGFFDYGMGINFGHSEYAPVTYIEPFSGNNLNVFGFDNFSDATRKSIMKFSQENDEPAISDPVCLVQEKDGVIHSSFLMFHSLYGKKVPHTTSDDRKNNILGWSAVAFRFSDLIYQISPNGFKDIDLRIYDGTEEDAKKLLFDSYAGKTLQSRFGIKKLKTVNLANREMTFVIRSTVEFEKSMHHQEYLDNIIYTGGLATFLITIFSFIFLQSIIRIVEGATHDGLTGLHNRIGFLNGLKASLAHANRMGTSVALMFIDLDRFKHINDTYGHHIGDELLRQVAIRMQECIRIEDNIGRQGGDEFLLAISDLKNSDAASSVATKIINFLGKPFVIHGHEMFIGSSIGIALYPEDTRNIDDLQRLADLAMYSVKNNGRNDYSFYSIEMQKSSQEYQMIITALHHAIEREEFSMVYQPIVNVRSGKIEGMEALLRWNQPELGEVSPTKFIPIAESDSEIIGSIGKWTLRSVCEQIVLWKKSGIEVPKISVNLSAQQFLSETLVSDILDILEETGVFPHQIGLEITEGTFFKKIASAITIVDTLSDLGFEISIDDFGTGYSSLSYLRHFQASKLKIDQSFILDIDTEDGRAMIRAIIALGHNLRIKVVAEGVENLLQVLILKDLGCDYIQGYHYGKPENADKIFPRLVSTNVTSIIDGNKEI